MTSRRRQSARSGTPRLPGLRRWLLRLSLLLAFALLLTVGWRVWGWVLSPSALPIRVVTVEGAGSRISPQAVRQIVSAHLNAGFFGLDLKMIAQALKQIPWVYRANVQRRWPDTLIIRLQPQKAVAYWGKAALLNAQGDVFSPPPATFPKGLPALDGPDGKEHELMQRYLEAKSLFAADGLQVNAVSEDARRAYRLWFANGIELVVGRDWDTARMARMAAVYARVLAPKAAEIARIDLRYPNGFAVAWKHSKTNGAAVPAKE